MIVFCGKELFPVGFKKILLGDRVIFQNGEKQKLSTPIIRLVDETEIKKLSAPVIRIEEVFEPVVPDKLSSPVIRLEIVSDDVPVVPSKLGTPYITLFVEEEEPEEPDVPKKLTAPTIRIVKAINPFVGKLAKPVIRLEIIEEGGEPEEPDIPVIKKLDAPVIELEIIEDEQVIPIPTNLRVEGDTLYWDFEGVAERYEVEITPKGVGITQTSYKTNKYMWNPFFHGDGDYEITVRAIVLDKNGDEQYSEGATINVVYKEIKKLNKPFIEIVDDEEIPEEPDVPEAKKLAAPVINLEAIEENVLGIVLSIEGSVISWTTSGEVSPTVMLLTYDEILSNGTYYQLQNGEEYPIIWGGSGSSFDVAERVAGKPNGIYRFFASVQDYNGNEVISNTVEYKVEGAKLGVPEIYMVPSAPTNLRIVDDTLYWDSDIYAKYFYVRANGLGKMVTTEENFLYLPDWLGKYSKDSFTLCVFALSDKNLPFSMASDASESIEYIKKEPLSITLDGHYLTVNREADAYRILASESLSAGITLEVGGVNYAFIGASSVNPIYLPGALSDYIPKGEVELWVSDDGKEISNPVTYNVEFLKLGAPRDIYLSGSILNKPYLALTGNTLWWSTVKGADGYAIYYRKAGEQQFYILGGTESQTSCTFDITHWAENRIEPGEYEIFINAVDYEGDNSEMSNTITYVKEQ